MKLLQAAARSVTESNDVRAVLPQAAFESRPLGVIGERTNPASWS
jgi:hypothetical protein